MSKRFSFIFLFAAVLVTSLSLKSQYRTDYGGRIGVSVFQGDLGANNILGVDFGNTGYSLGLGVRHFISQKFAVKAELGFCNLRGDDKKAKSDAVFSRNLNFRNNIVEVTGTVEWHFLIIKNISKNYYLNLDFRCFAFSGFGAFYNNPKAKYDGKWVALRPLMTEGVNYNSIQALWPLGVGCEFKFQKKHHVGFQLRLAKTFTDYVDDVSGRYLHYTEFTDPIALELQDRSIELANANEPRFIGSDNYSYGTNKKETAPRGNSNKKDAYILAGFTYSYSIKGKTKFYNSKFQYKKGVQRGVQRRRKSRSRF